MSVSVNGWYDVSEKHPPIGSKIEIRVGECPHACTGSYMGVINQVVGVPEELGDEWPLNLEGSLFIVSWRYIQ